MKLVRNTGNDRVVDLIRSAMGEDKAVGIVSPQLSVFAFAELSQDLDRLTRCRLVLGHDVDALGLLGSDADRSRRNQLQSRWLASQLARWLAAKTDLRRSIEPVPQSALVVHDHSGSPERTLVGSFALTTDGLGLTPGNPLSIIQTSESPEEAGSCTSLVRLRKHPCSRQEPRRSRSCRVHQEQ